MAFQDEQHEDTLTASQEAPVASDLTPQAPEFAPSEQFAFPEVISTAQANTDTLAQPSEIIASDASFFTEAPDQQFPTEQASLVEHISYPNYPAYQLPTQQGAPQQPTQRKRLSITAKIALSLAIVLVILGGGGGLFYDLAYYQPYQAQLAAQAAATATTNAQATSTVSSASTAIASIDATGTAQAQATAQAYQDVYTQATSGTPVLNDSLKQQGSGAWDEGPYINNYACTFKNGSYHAIAPHAGYFIPCYEGARSFGNFAFQVDITITKGDDAGILFHANDANEKYYFFGIDNAGDYYLILYNGPKDDQRLTIFSSATSDIQSGKNQITVIAKGNIFYFYLNQHILTSTIDGTLTSGLIALAASDDHNATDVAFNNAKVWVL